MLKIVLIILYLLGSIGIFLFGLRLLSSGIQKILGNIMRKMLNIRTGSNLRWMGIGIGITAIIQTSSSTSVMAMSFINAGLISVEKTLSLIIGSNIATIILLWIVFLISAKINYLYISLPFIAITLPLFYLKKDKLKSFAEALTGISLFSLGLHFFSNTIIENKNIIIDTINTYYSFSISLFLFLSLLFTFFFQSALATLSLAVILFLINAIDLNHFFAIAIGNYFGEQIFLLHISKNTNVFSKRSSLSYFVYSIVFLIIVICLLIIKKDDLALIFNINKTVIALVIITIFYVLYAIVYLLCYKLIIKLSERFFKLNISSDQLCNLNYIESGFIDTSEIAILEAGKEIKKYCEFSIRMFNLIPKLLHENDNKEFEFLLNKIKKYEQASDNIENRITQFLIKISKNELSEESYLKMRRFRRICNEIEKIGDNCYKMSKLLNLKKNEKIYFNQNQRDILKNMFLLVNKSFDIMIENFSISNPDIHKAKEIENEINKFRDKIKSIVFEDIEKGDYSFKSGYYLNKLSTTSEKIGDTIFNINENICGTIIE